MLNKGGAAGAKEVVRARVRPRKPTLPAQVKTPVLPFNTSDFFDFTLKPIS
jgi:hypothetical protein